MQYRFYSWIAYFQAFANFATTVVTFSLVKSVGSTSNFLKRTISENSSTLPQVEGIEICRFNVPGSIQDITLQNNTAYVAAGETGLHIVDVSNVENPKMLSQFDTPGFTHRLAVVGGYSYLADDLTGLMIINTNDTRAPTLSGSYSMGNNPLKIPVTHLAIVNDNALIMSEATSEWDIVDISIPEKVFRNFLKTPGSAFRVFVDNTTAYVTDTKGLQIIDISQISNPTWVGGYNTSTSSAYDVVVIGKIGYVAAGYSGLIILDLTNQKTPRLLGSIKTLLSATSVFVDGNIAYFTDFSEGLYIVNVTNPSQPALISSLSTSGHAERVVVRNNMAYIADGDPGFLIINVTNPKTPKLIGSHSTPEYAFDICLENNTLYLADESYGLYIYDVTDPKNTSLIGHLPTAIGARGVTVEGNYAYVSIAGSLSSLDNSKSTLLLVDISVPTNPKLLRNISTPGSARNTFVVNDIAFVADYDGGLQIFSAYSGLQLNKSPVNFRGNKFLTDLFLYKNLFFYTAQDLGLGWMDSLAFKIAWNIDTPGNGASVRILEDVAFVADGKLGLQIINISNFSNPQFLANFTTTGSVLNIEVMNDLVFISDFFLGLLIINVTNPRTPFLQGSIDTGGSSEGLTVVGNFTYLGDSSGLEIIDIRNVSDPKYAGYSSILARVGSVSDVAVEGNIAYMAVSSFGTESGLQIVDITIPSLTRVLSYFLTPADANSIVLQDNLAFVSQGIGFGQGLLIFDISDSAGPQLLGNFTSPETVYGISVMNNTVYISVYHTGLQVIDATDPSQPYLIRSCDTPGTSDVTIDNNYAYLANGLNGIEILNLSENQYHYLTEAMASQVVIVNEMAFVTDNNKNLYILNITSLDNFIEITRYLLPFYAVDLQVNTSLLYVAEGIEGVEIIDISNTTHPTSIGRITAGLTNARGLLVENNHLYVIDHNKDIVIFKFNPLIYLPGQLTIEEAGTYVLNSAELLVFSFNLSASQIFIMPEEVSHGHFEVMSQQSVVIYNFSLFQVENNQIIFVHDGSEEKPSFKLSFTDGTTTEGPYVANINYVSINDPPVLLNNYFRINEGENFILNLSNLNATDKETPSAQLEYVIIQESHSQFERSSQKGFILTRFTQQQILYSDVFLKHISQNTNNDLTPFFSIVVSDGDIELSPQPAVIDYNAAPKFIHNELNISRGQVIAITHNELEAFDRDDANETLIFMVSNVNHGLFNKNNFTQGEIAEGTITFLHDNSAEAPTYTVRIQDKRMQTSAQRVRVTFTNANPDLILDPVGIGLTVAGGVVGAVLIGVGFFSYRKYSQNQQSRKSDRYAAALYEVLQPHHAENFNSPTGQRFVQSLKSLKIELKNQGIDVDNMGNWELNQLAEQITHAIQCELKPKTNWRRENLIDGNDINNASMALAQAVQKIRAGVYDDGVQLGV